MVASAIVPCAVIFGSLLVFGWFAQRALKLSGVSLTTPRQPAPSAPSAGQVLIAVIYLLLSVAAFTSFTVLKAPGTDPFRPVILFTLVFFPIIALSVEAWREGFAGWTARAPFKVSILWIALLGVLAVSNPSFSPWPLIRVGAVGCVAFALLGRKPIAGNAINYPLFIMMTVLVIWVPIEFDFFQAYRLGVKPAQFDISRILVYVLGLTLFLVVARLPRIGYIYALRWKDARTAIVGLLVLSAIMLPLGFVLGFLSWNPKSFNGAEWFGRAIYIYFCIAIPEELMFRGVIQNTLEHHWPTSTRKFMPVMIGSLIYGASVFGIAHINNPMNNFPVPNWPYVIMSGLAGAVYGVVWQRTRRITASALTHMAVDWMWVTYFALK